MVLMSEIGITARVIFRALFPCRSGSAPCEAGDTPHPPDRTRTIPPASIAWYSGNLGLIARRDGRLSFYFPGCRAPAAPFLLFRLKREGFSNCSAAADADGLRLEADR
jgi:hypothetical protein